MCCRQYNWTRVGTLYQNLAKYSLVSRHTFLPPHKSLHINLFPSCMWDSVGTSALLYSISDWSRLLSAHPTRAFTEVPTEMTFLSIPFKQCLPFIFVLEDHNAYFVLRVMETFSFVWIHLNLSLFQAHNDLLRQLKNKGFQVTGLYKRPDIMLMFKQESG